MTQKSDQLDTYDLAVWKVKQALEAVHEVGLGMRSPNKRLWAGDGAGTTYSVDAWRSHTGKHSRSTF